ncbi:MAG TPA: hypothetical protein VFB14_19835 [Bryobacteraceae bacterium]|jgi:hypothetical protein|nr:hypothetical protein [Bryobacteraceae bacterium]
MVRYDSEIPDYYGQLLQQYSLAKSMADRYEKEIYILREALTQVREICLGSVEEPEQCRAAIQQVKEAVRQALEVWATLEHHSQLKSLGDSWP